MLTPDSSRRLRIPEGTEGFSLHDAYRHREVTRLAEEIFTSWGYLPAQLPVFDYFDSYRSLVDDEELPGIYRLVDRDGDLLMLRSDMTLFLAKHLGAHSGRPEGPVRICYGDSILRHQASEDISHHEFYQLGAELIGIAELRGDIEVAALLGEIVSRLGVEAPVLHIGTRALLRESVGTLDPPAQARAAEAVIARDFGSLSELCGRDMQWFSFIGSDDEFAGLRSVVETAFPDAGVAAALDDLAMLAGTLRRVGTPFDVRIDLSEIGSRNYYTGCVFSMYVDGVATAVASGGRYDDLLMHFGDRRPAVGFSLMPRKIERSLPGSARLEPPSVVRVDSADIAEALAEARKLRSSGKAASL